MKAKVARFALKFLRTSRYVTELLVWSRIFVARRTSANICINDTLRADKGIPHLQPQMTVVGTEHLQHFQHGFDIIYDLLFANLRKPNRVLPMRHALPGPAFAGVYLWDSAFISLIWRHWDCVVASDILRSVISVRDGDKLQHVVADFVRSEFTQPPLIAWALVRANLDEHIGKHELLEIYGALKNFNGWLNRHRRLANGLYFWEHPYESGVENSPRFSSCDEKTLSDTRVLAAPDFSAYVILQCDALVVLAKRLDDAAGVQKFSQEAARIRQTMEALLWHETDGLYYDYAENSASHVRSRTIASLIPLAAGVPSRERAERLRQHICDPRMFGSLVPLPSVAISDPQFEKDMWRGPVWINTAFLVLDGLRRYEFWPEYSALTWRLCDGVFQVLKEEHQVYEFYDPEYFHTRELHRKKGNWWKALTLGTGPQKDFVGWSGLVNVLIIEGLFGVQLASKTLLLRPGFPAAVAGAIFKLFLPQDRLELRVEVTTDHRYRGFVSVSGSQKNFDLTFGESLAVPFDPSEMPS